ncbi:hypothetical protein L0Y59_01725 [Candidatus Uhrbacteria bacterium]|nr:hypothetical protein [Candidatus Uhrbacteria bacterium]
MNRLLPLLLVLLGAGCSAATPSDIGFGTPNRETPPLAEDVCAMDPWTNDAGATEYPTHPRYVRLSYLGQIFTALDCGDEGRATGVMGMREGAYAAGIILSWGRGAPPEALKTTLTRLGFTSVDAGAWKTDHPLSLDDLRTLRGVLIETGGLESLEFADCIRCG